MTISFFRNKKKIIIELILILYFLIIIANNCGHEGIEIGITAEFFTILTLQREKSFDSCYEQSR